jgi:hypothetical protein
MRSKAADVADAVSQLVYQGCKREVRIKDGRLCDEAHSSALDPKDIHVDTALRLASGRDGEDASSIYAISDLQSHSTGLLIDAYDIFDEICDHGLAEWLGESRKTEFIDDSDVPCRYGLRKVYRREYDCNPERYVLRIDYPDFSECPFGESFSMLGFDMAEQTYVWPVSILWDSRLNRVRYQGLDGPDNE